MSKGPESIHVDTSWHTLPEDDLGPVRKFADVIFEIEKDSPAPSPFPLAASSGPIRRRESVLIITHQSSALQG